MKNATKEQASPQNLRFETDYAFRPTPAGFLDILEEYHAGLLDGSLQLVLRRCVTPNVWCIVKAIAEPDRENRWPAESIVLRLAAKPDMVLFTEGDASRACVDYGSHMAAYIPMATTNAFADSGKPLWTRYAVNTKALAKLMKRREKAVKCAESFNAHFGKVPCAVSQLSNEALAVLCLQRTYLNNEEPVWMHRSLADAVLQAVRAGHAWVVADGSVKSNLQSIEQAIAERVRRQLYLSWDDPAHVQKRIEALRAHRNYGFASFKGKYPDTAYGMRSLY